MFDFINIPFGYLMHFLYSVSGNSYLISLILFSVVLKIVLFPLGIKQQKNSQKQAKLRPKENVIRKKYAGRTDRATQLKMNTEIQELYQKEKFSPLAGCLPLIVQLIILLAVYGVVQSPMTYLYRYDVAVLNETKATVVEMIKAEDPELVANYLSVKKGYSEEEYQQALDEAKFQRYSEIKMIDYVNTHNDAFVNAFNARTADKGLIMNGEAVVENMPNLELGGGFNLGTAPKDVFGNLFRAGPWGEKLLLLIPVLNLVLSYIGQALTRKFTYQPEQSADMQSQMRMMNITMPLFSLFIAFTLPVAVGIYWMMTSVLAPVQQYILSKMYPIPVISPEEMREAERLYGGKTKKKKVKGDPAKKKKSLVYDDDDEYESVSSVKEVKVIKEKESVPGESVVEKAPLKDEDKTK